MKSLSLLSLASLLTIASAHADSWMPSGNYNFAQAFCSQSEKVLSLDSDPTSPKSISISFGTQKALFTIFNKDGTSDQKEVNFVPVRNIVLLAGVGSDAQMLIVVQNSSGISLIAPSAIIGGGDDKNGCADGEPLVIDFAPGPVPQPQPSAQPSAR